MLELDEEFRTYIAELNENNMYHVKFNSEKNMYHEKFNTENYSRIVENGFLNALKNPLSTFSIDVKIHPTSSLIEEYNESLKEFLPNLKIYQKKD